MNDESKINLSKGEERKADENIQKVMEYCKKITLRLTRLSEDQKILQE